MYKSSPTELIRGFLIFYSKQISYVLGDFHLCSYFLKFQNMSFYDTFVGNFC